jgi:hypothetical protein
MALYLRRCWPRKEKAPGLSDLELMATIRSQKNVSRVLISVDDLALDDRYLMKVVGSCTDRSGPGPLAHGLIPPPFSVEK